jgi:hypothetical protein
MVRNMSIITILLIIAIITCMVLAYLWVDRSISLSYARQSVDMGNNVINGLESLLEEEWRGMPESEVFQKLKKTAAMRKPEAIIKKEGTIIWFDDIPFKFEKEMLAKIGDD